MVKKVIVYSSVLIFYWTTTHFPQDERYTKGAENGYTWLAMDDPNLMYNTSKENYLGSILDRIRITQEKHPEIASLSCREDINKLLSEGKSEEISLEDVAKEIDKFYSRNENLVIPIIFAYCYTIKKLAGVKVKELDKYREDVLLYCYE